MLYAGLLAGEIRGISSLPDSFHLHGKQNCSKGGLHKANIAYQIWNNMLGFLLYPINTTLVI